MLLLIVRVRNVLFLCLALMACSSISSAAEEIKDPSDVYSKISQLNNKFVEMMRFQFRQKPNVEIEDYLISREIQPRHVFQLALDVEGKIISLMRVYGVDVMPSRGLQVREYSPTEVFNLVESLTEKTQSLLSFSQINTRVADDIHTDKVPADVYHLLRRMEIVLIKMGAPKTRPGNVLKRAQAIAFVASTLCRHSLCDDVKKADMRDRTITPNEVYEETYKFISALERYVLNYGVDIKGGVLALPIEKKHITPTDVNHLMSVALADAIAVMQNDNKMSHITLDSFNPDAMPKNVWREIDYARRLLQVMISAKG